MYHLSPQERIKEKETGVSGSGGGEEERGRKRQVGRREEEETEREDSKTEYSEKAEIQE